MRRALLALAGLLAVLLPVSVQAPALSAPAAPAPVSVPAPPPAPVSIPAPARRAGDGCPSNRFGKLATWSREREFDFVGTSTKGTIVLSAGLDYVYCPTFETANRKAKYLNLTYCWSFPGKSSPPNFFNGVSMDSSFLNRPETEAMGLKNIWVDPIAIPEKNAGVNCKLVWLTYEQERVEGDMLNAWWSIVNDPFWTVAYEVRWSQGRPNWNGQFYMNGFDPKRFVTGVDPTYAGPYRVAVG